MKNRTDAVGEAIAGAELGPGRIDDNAPAGLVDALPENLVDRDSSFRLMTPIDYRRGHGLGRPCIGHSRERYAKHRKEQSWWKEKDFRHATSVAAGTAALNSLFGLVPDCSLCGEGHFILASVLERCVRPSRKLE